MGRYAERDVHADVYVTHDVTPDGTPGRSGRLKAKLDHITCSLDGLNRYFQRFNRYTTQAAERYHRPSSLGELEISIAPRIPIDKETAQRFAELGVHRLILIPPWGKDAPALVQWITTLGETLIGQV